MPVALKVPGRRATPRGATLVECLVALVVSGVLTAAVYAALLAGSRLARSASAALELHHGVRAAAAVLRAELQLLSPSAGDLLALSDSAVTVRAQRGFGVTCAAPGGSSLVLADSLFAALRWPDPSKDSVLVFAAGDVLTTADDRWVAAAVTATWSGTCPNGSTGLQLTLAAANPADLAAVAPGAPLRLYEILEYRRYRDASGQWWLGVRGPAAGGGWAATSPIAGPLRPLDGLTLRGVDSSGAAAAAMAAVRLVDITVRGVAARMPLPGARPVDSLALRVALGDP